jgi:hypothetical protein
MSLIRVFIDGPEVSLKGSPTTVAICASDCLPLRWPLAISQHIGDFLLSVAHCIMKQWELIRREWAEYICNNLVPAGGTSDTDTNSEELSRSQMFDNRLHTMVASVAPFHFEFDAAEMEIEIVVGNDQIVGRYREMRTQIGYRLAAGIHIGQRQGEHDRLRFDRALPINCRREMVPQGNMTGCPQAIDEPEAYVMAGISIMRARIA